jgi:ketosteroid isomerase-like protein
LTPTDQIHAVDADALAGFFAEDGALLLLYREPLEGPLAIRDNWARFFAEWDPGAWQAEHHLVEADGDRAHALSIYSETLVHRAGAAPSRVVRGRAAYFLRREPDGAWRITLLMNSHSRPVETIEPEAGSAAAET